MDKPKSAFITTSAQVHNREWHKTLLCIWWDNSGVMCNELVIPGETITGDRYWQQLIKLNRALRGKRP